MELCKHTNAEKPKSIQVLMLIDVIDDNSNFYTWTTGFWDGEGWHCDYNNKLYNVIEWYDLPSYPKKGKDTRTLREMLDDFWNDR